MAHHDTGKPMAGARGLHRVGARQPCSEIGRRKAITGCGGVHHGGGHRLGLDALWNAFDADDADGLGELEDSLVARDFREQAIRALARVKRQQILGRGKRDVRGLEGLAEDSPCDLQIGPTAGAEIGVEGDARAAPARLTAAPPATALSRFR